MALKKTNNIFRCSIGCSVFKRHSARDHLVNFFKPSRPILRPKIWHSEFLSIFFNDNVSYYQFPSVYKNESALSKKKKKKGKPHNPTPVC